MVAEMAKNGTDTITTNVVVNCYPLVIPITIWATAILKVPLMGTSVAA